MSKRIGVWIDHEKAILTLLENGSVDTRKIASGVGPRVRLSGGSRSKTAFGPQENASDTQRDRKYARELTAYYRRVVRELADAESILVFGPGEAKGELAKEIERTPSLGPKIAGVETADKMTDRQIAAHVKDFFRAGVHRPRKA